MEFLKTKYKAYNIDIIHIYNKYYFVNGANIVCIATNNKNVYTLQVGNKNFLGSSLTDDIVITMVKKFINKSEKTYKNLSYSIVKTDLKHCELKIIESFF